ncbi:MAG: carboxypeptidase-like regulatory domain-containing protein [Acidobacteriota bacterium]|nr:carboxypeptidase-like regulatory domain-containing protein [Acidobacteriota bacterium]
MRGCLLPALILASLAAYAEATQEISPVQVAVALGSGSPVKVEALVLAECRSRQGIVKHTEQALTAPGEVVLAIPSDSANMACQLSVQAAGYWSPAARLQPASRSPVRFLLWPTGKIAGEVTAPPQERRPQAFEVRFQPAAGSAGSAGPSGLVYCPIDGDHGDQWSCEVPSGRLDIRVRAEDLIPLYLWSVEVPRHGQVPVGPYRLVRGASLLGRVELEGQRGKPGQNPSVELRVLRHGHGPGTAAPAERLSEKTLTAQVDDRGYFLVAGIASGAYIVTPQLTGFVPERSPTVTVQPGGLIELPEPLVLRRPAELVVQLAPAVDSYGQPWRLNLLRADPPESRIERAGEGATDLSGLWRKAGLTPGRYLVTVGDSTGSEWLREWTEITFGGPPLGLTIDLVRVEGRITQGRQPLAVAFWLVRKDSGARIRFRSDDRGHFAGFLPVEGKWTVELDRGGPGVQALAPIEVKRMAGSPAAKLDIRVPDTRLSIAVTDPEGNPAPRAHLLVMSSPEKGRREAEAIADGKGEVTLRGLTPGLLYLFADAGSSSSEWVPHSLVEEADDPPVELRLRERLHVNGRVISAEGPIGGALVIVVPFVVSGGNAWQARALAEADGTFQLALDRPFPGGSLAVFAAGFATRLLAVPPTLSADRELLLQLSQESGNLEVDLAGFGGGGKRIRGWIVHQTAQLPLSAFLTEGVAQLHDKDDAALVSGLEPGDYLLCPDPFSLPARCAAGYLPAGGQLRLSLKNSRGAS